MKRLLKGLSVFLICMMGMSLSTYAASNTSAKNVETDANDDQINRVAAITEVMPEGQKVTAVAIKYDKKIDNSKLTASDFSVEGRTITKVYANDTADKSDKGKNGRYVVIELSPDDSNAATVVSQGEGMNSRMVREDVKVSVTQLKDIEYVDGSTCVAMTEPVVNDREVNLVVDDFKKLEYTDPATGVTLKYSLYIPKNYDPNKSYPMVTFIHDLSLVSNEDDIALSQGYGGVIFASPSEQAKHEAFVLIPQYSEEIVSNDSIVTQQGQATIGLIDSLVKQYSIDKDRLYDTGQSMGCMSSIGLNIQYPDKFAALLLVAGQWDTSQVSVLKDKNIWAIVSEGDEKAYPGMTAIMDSLEAAGGKVSRSVWSGLATKEEQDANVKSVLKQNCNINFTVLEKGTVVPAGQEDSSGANHTNTWRIAYQIEGVRDWLFAQKK